jgi:hypothetical protein
MIYIISHGQYDDYTIDFVEAAMLPLYYEGLTFRSTLTREPG